MPYELITRLLGFPNFRLVDIEIEERYVVLTIEGEEMTSRCGSCGCDAGEGPSMPMDKGHFECNRI